MDADSALFFQLLRDLVLREATWWREATIPKDLADVYEYLSRTLRKIDESEISTLLQRRPMKGSLLDIDGFIFMKPSQTRAWAVPVLSVEYELRRPLKVGLRLGVFLNGDDRYRIAATGYRLESPEASPTHGYHHVQHIVEFGNDRHPIPCPRWLPQTQPAFPIEARTPAGLVIALLVSIYGADSEEVREALTGSNRTMLRPHLQELMWAKDLVPRAN